MTQTKLQVPDSTSSYHPLSRFNIPVQLSRKMYKLRNFRSNRQDIESNYASNKTDTCIVSPKDQFICTLAIPLFYRRMATRRQTDSKGENKSCILVNFIKII